MISVAVQILVLKASSSAKGRGANDWVETDRLKIKKPACIGEGRANGTYDFDETKEKEPRSSERIRIRRFRAYRTALAAGAQNLQISLGRVPYLIGFGAPLARTSTVMCIRLDCFSSWRLPALRIMSFRMRAYLLCLGSGDEGPRGTIYIS